MNNHGYERNLNENLHEVETTCMSCKGKGRLTTIRLRDIEPEEVICVVKCENCGTKHVSFFDKTYDKRGCVRIECCFDDPKDLHREINLNQMASVEIVSDGFSYKYETSVPGVHTVESLLRQAEDEVKNLCGKDDITSGGRGRIIGEVDVSKKECEKQLDNIQNLIRTPKFKMTIEDEFGLSRVAPVGKGVFELQNAEISNFDDEKVKHFFGKKK